MSTAAPDPISQNRKYANTVATVGLVFFLLFIMWKNDAHFIVKVALDDVSYLSEKFYGFTPKMFLIITMYVVFRAFSFLFIDIVVKRIHGFYPASYEFSIVSRMMKLVLWTVFGFLALTLVFEDSFGTVITSLGLVGFGITFALQKPILNFVGWLTVSVKGVYRVGDRIRVGTVRGDVREINVMNTVLEGLLDTADVKSGKTVTIPNEAVLTDGVENYTRMGNSIVNELTVSITYESDYRRAQDLLHKIASAVTVENKKVIKKSLLEERQGIEHTLLKLGEELVNTTRMRRRKIEAQMRKLEEEEKSLKTQADELEEEFRPKVRVELNASSIDLICFFVTPYDQVKASRSRINTLFLEAVAKEKKIDIAYPHMELVFNDSAHRLQQ